jgi:hypothetical protein
MTTKLPAFVLAALLLIPATAAADATFFYGRQTAADDKSSTRGFAVGVSLAIVGFEFEYANIKEDQTLLRPSLKTTSGNVLLQTVGIPIQFYFTTGGGYYMEELGNDEEKAFLWNTGGGAKLPIAGPLRARVDYRIFNLKGSPRDKTQHRLYAGANLSF